MKPKLKKIIIISLAILALAGIVGAIFLLINSSKNTTLSILVTPVDSKITINNKEYKNGNYKIFPKDKVEVTIEHEGFETKNLTIDSKGKKIIKVHEYLETSDMNKYRESGEDHKVLRLIADYSDNRISSFIEESNKIESIKYQLPVWTAAPYNRFEVTSPGIKLIDGTSDLECKKIFCIKALIGGKRTSAEDKAIEDKIRGLGFDPKDYQLIYVENHNVENYNDEE